MTNRKELGEQLFKAGWSQGVLLPLLPWGLTYQIDDPLSKIAKAASSRHTGDGQGKSPSAAPVPSFQNVAVALGTARKQDYFVVASQDCDIASDAEVEPNIIAMRAFVTDNKNILRYAGSNSAVYFLLDPGRGLVAHATIMVSIEKPVLAKLTPEPGAIDAATKQRFTQWIGHRFGRPALTDSVVEAVTKPILDNLSQMQKNGDPALDVFDTIREVRLTNVIGDPPYHVHLLFIVPESGLPDGGAALTLLTARMNQWFDPQTVCSFTWETCDFDQITVNKYLNSQKIYLDHYTYRGRTIQGLLPPPVLP